MDVRTASAKELLELVDAELIAHEEAREALGLPRSEGPAVLLRITVGFGGGDEGGTVGALTNELSAAPRIFDRRA